MVAQVGVISFSLSSSTYLPRRPLFFSKHKPFATAAMSDDPIREWILSEGKATSITRISPIGGGCINLASRYDTDAGSFFVKTNRGIGPSMFEGEALGLSAMYETRSIRVPRPFKPEHRGTGLRPAVVAAIPTMTFTHEAFSSLEDAQCTICLGEYQEKEVLRIMPKCGHSFHLSCIDVWLRKQSTCPVCRLSVEDPFKAKCVSPATLEMARTMNTPEILIEHSQQWLLPAAEQSQGNGSNHGHTESASENLEPIRYGVAEARS